MCLRAAFFVAIGDVGQTVRCSLCCTAYMSLAFLAILRQHQNHAPNAGGCCDCSQSVRTSGEDKARRSVEPVSKVPKGKVVQGRVEVSYPVVLKRTRLWSLAPSCIDGALRFILSVAIFSPTPFCCSLPSQRYK